MRRVLAAAGAAMIAFALLLAPASAMAPDAQGWWWFGQPSGSPVPVPAPPFVPEDGLYVASNPTGAEAISALRFGLPEPPATGVTGTLTLVVAGEVRGTPVLGLCVVTEEWEPVQGGPLGDAPPFDCEAGASAGTIAEDGTTVSFPTGSVTRDGTIDVAVVPGVDEGDGNPTFQIAFESPGADALAFAPAAAAPTTSEAPAPPPTSGSVAAAPSAPSFTPARVPPSAPAPESAVSAPVDIGSAGGGPVAPPSTSSGPAVAAAPASESDDSNRTRLLGFVVLAAVGVAYHRLSTTPDRPPTALVRFGQLPEEAEEPTMAGAAT